MSDCRVFKRAVVGSWSQSPTDGGRRRARRDWVGVCEGCGKQVRAGLPYGSTRKSVRDALYRHRRNCQPGHGGAA